MCKRGIFQVSFMTLPKKLIDLAQDVGVDNTKGHADKVLSGLLSPDSCLLADRRDAYPTSERHCYRLGFEIGLEAFFAQLAAVAGHFIAAEGSGGVEDVVAVDPDGAGAEFGGQGMGLGD